MPTKSLKMENARLQKDLATAKEEAGQKLFETQEKLRAAIESMDDAVFISDNHGDLVHFNNAFATFHKFKDKQECLERLKDYPKSLEVFYPNGEPLPFEQWVVNRALRGESETNDEYTLRCKDTGGSWIGSYNYAPFFDQQGNVAGSVVVARDITEQKRVSDLLKESEERFKALSVATFGGVMICDKGLILDCNQALSDMSGFTHEELIGMDALTLFTHESFGRVMKNIKSGYNQRYEAEGVRKDGSRYHLSVKGKNVTYKGREARVVEFRDITECKKNELELQEAKSELDCKNNMLEETNIALNVVIRQQERNKEMLEQNILFNVEKLLVPTLAKLKDKASDRTQKAYLDILESNLDQITSPFFPPVANYLLKLTPAQIQIANLIKQGMTTKEIANLLNLSPATIAVHRQNIRNRIGVPPKTSLRTVLMTNE